MTSQPRDYLQDTLDVDVGDETRERAQRQAGVKGSVSRMVDLALERGYAADVGDLLDQAASLRQHRLFNALLACLQRPHADYLLQSHEWEDQWRRRVRPNEHPIVLMVPFQPVGFYFDVSQTEETAQSRQLPAIFENPYRMEFMQDAPIAVAALRSRVLGDGVRVSQAPMGHRSAGHIARARGGTHEVPVRSHRKVVIEKRAVRFEVTLNSTSSDTERLATLAHEIGHLYCGHLGAAASDWWPDRSDLDERQCEFEAESAARLVFRRIAPDTELPDHLTQYFDLNEQLPDMGWPRVVSAADRMIDHCIAGSSESSAALVPGPLDAETP